MKANYLVAGGLSVILSVSFGLWGSLAHAAQDTCGGLEPTIVGTNGDDDIVGTSGDDVIHGGAGDDMIAGGAGNDVICGGAGDDDLWGQGGDDVLFGGAGDDFLDGGEPGCCDRDTNTGDDELYGGNGNDILHTSDFPTDGSFLAGENGMDEIYVWSGGEAYGGNGDDELYQYGGDTLLDGGRGDDLLVNWNDPDSETVTMRGGRGDDFLVSEDLTGTTDQDGGKGFDSCLSGTTSVDCEN